MNPKSLARIYLAERRNHTGNNSPVHLFLQSNVVKTCFDKLVKKLTSLHDEAGIDVDPFNYVKSHFEFFGAETYPQHLISEWSYSIYVLWQSQQEQGKTLEPASFEQQSELLTYLMECRNCPAEEIIDQMGFLFSDEFVNG